MCMKANKKSKNCPYLLKRGKKQNKKKKKKKKRNKTKQSIQERHMPIYILHLSKSIVRSGHACGLRPQVFGLHSFCFKRLTVPAQT